MLVLRAVLLVAAVAVSTLEAVGADPVAQPMVRESAPEIFYMQDDAGRLVLIDEALTRAGVGFEGDLGIGEAGLDQGFDGISGHRHRRGILDFEPGGEEGFIRCTQLCH